MGKMRVHLHGEWMGDTAYEDLLVIRPGCAGSPFVSGRITREQCMLEVEESAEAMQFAEDACYELSVPAITVRELAEWWNYAELYRDGCCSFGGPVRSEDCYVLMRHEKYRLPGTGPEMEDLELVQTVLKKGRSTCVPPVNESELLRDALDVSIEITGLEDHVELAHLIIGELNAMELPFAMKWSNGCIELEGQVGPGDEEEELRERCRLIKATTVVAVTAPGPRARDVVAFVRGVEVNEKYRISSSMGA